MSQCLNALLPQCPNAFLLFIVAAVQVCDATMLNSIHSARLIKNNLFEAAPNK